MTKTDYQTEGAVLFTIRESGTAPDGTVGYFGEILRPDEVSVHPFFVFTMSLTREEAVTETLSNIETGSIVVELQPYEFYQEQAERRFYHAKAQSR